MSENKLDKWLEETKQYAVERFWKEMANQHVTEHKNTEGNSHWRTFGTGQFPEIGFPRCDIAKSDGKIIVEAELPGVLTESAAYTIEGRKLVIKGEFSTLHPGWTYIQKERQDRLFERELHIPNDIDTDSISSRLQDGILTIILPIREEEKAISVHIPLTSILEEHGSTI